MGTLSPLQISIFLWSHDRDIFFFVSTDAQETVWEGRRFTRGNGSLTPDLTPTFRGLAKYWLPSVTFSDSASPDTRSQPTAKAEATSSLRVSTAKFQTSGSLIGNRN
jgi:hypothetical protein